MHDKSACEHAAVTDTEKLETNFIVSVNRILVPDVDRDLRRVFGRKTFRESISVRGLNSGIPYHATLVYGSGGGVASGPDTRS